MSLTNTIRFIINHPLNKNNKTAALFRFFTWQIRSRISARPYIHHFVNDSKLILKRGLSGATGNLYCGLHEFEDMSFLLHYLRKNDLFADIGANVGSYSILASCVTQANTIAIEPIPSTYQMLTQNIKINNAHDKIVALNIGISSSSGIIRFTQNQDTTNHVAVQGENNTLDVHVKTLDEIFKNQPPTLIKIDVEGFEMEVIKGAQEILNNPTLKAIIIELNGSGNRYGYNENIIHNMLLQYNFRAYTYKPFERKLEEANTFGIHNTIYIRDFSFVKNRIKSSPKIKILRSKI